MNNYTPRNIAIFISLIFSFITALVVLLSINFFYNTYDFIIPVIVFVIGVAVGFILIESFIEKFIYDKIRVIYKAIYNLKSPTNNQTETIDLNSDIVSEVSSKVEEWQKNQQKEIADLKRMEEYRREFLGNVSHELKTPIFNIQGYILTLLDGGLEDKEINVSYLKRAEKSVERMITIVEDLQSITQLETGELELDFEKFNIVDLAKDIIHAQEMNAKNKNITLKISDASEKTIFVSADRFRIRQVFTNLVINSIRYGIDGGETEIRFFDMDENILVEVADNGIGIDQKHLSRLFERFYRVDKHRSREQGGSGLGLAIVKHIIEAHNQVINVRSAEGVGSTFSFTLKKARK